MPRQGIVPSKAVTTQARVGLDAGMDLGVTLEVVLSNEAFLTRRAFELSIVEMCLYVGFDVLFTAKLLVAVLEDTYPLVVFGVWTLDVLLNIFESDACGHLGTLDIYASNACCASQTGN